MTISTAAWIGIAAGLVLAVVDYWFVLHIARKNIQSSDPNEVDAKLRPLKALMAAGFVIMPVLGYFVGDLLGN
jgi:hypothetical protein